MEKHQVEIWLSVDSSGVAAVSLDSADAAREALADETSGGDVRTVRILAYIALPQEKIDAEVDIPDEAGGIDTVAA